MTHLHLNQKEITLVLTVLMSGIISVYSDPGPCFYEGCKVNEKY